jgi:hypothetical protein
VIAAKKGLWAEKRVMTGMISRVTFFFDVVSGG